jgi:hypothetical protein
MTLEERCRKIEEWFGTELEWEDKDCNEDELRAFVECPAIHLHTNPNKPTDCLVYSGGAVHCMHQSCEEECRTVSEGLKIAVDAPKGDRKKRQEQSEIYQEAIALAKAIERLKPQIYAEYNPKKQGTRPKWTPREQWGRFFSLFAPDDVLWIGEKHNSGLSGIGHFRTVADWKNCKYGHFTCPAIFDSSGRTVRASAGVIKVPYRVIEFDKLHPDPDTNKRYSLALMWYLHEQEGVRLPLRVQIDSGHRSIHSWCDNDSEIFNNTFIQTLQFLGADPRVLKRSTQLVRMPGVLRDQNWQTLIWIS